MTRESKSRGGTRKGRRETLTAHNYKFSAMLVHRFAPVLTSTCLYPWLMTVFKYLGNNKKFALGLAAFLVLVPIPSQANIILGYNTDGSPIYGAEPPGATGPIATPENPSWIPNPDGTRTQAQLDYTYIPNAEENAKKPPEIISTAPPGMIQLGFNPDGTPIYGPEPQGATGPIATPENPSWIKNPDGTPTQAELDYTFIPDAEERAKAANTVEAKQIIEKEISSSKFTKVKKGNTFTLTSEVELSATTPEIRVIAVKKGSANRKVKFSISEDGQLVLKASQKLKGFQIQIISDEKILKRITL